MDVAAIDSTRKFYICAACAAPTGAIRTVPGVKVRRSVKISVLCGFGKYILPLVLALAGTAVPASVAQAPNPGDSSASLPPGPGREVFVQSCLTCHALGIAIDKRRTADDWRAEIQGMIGRGAPIDSTQADTILRYLRANFSAATSPALELPATPNESAKAIYPRPSGPDQWPAYGGGNANQNYSPLTQITPENVSKLEQAWVYHYGAGIVHVNDQGLDHRFEVTPLLIGDVMYISTPTSPATPGLKSSITALQPETGTVLWKYECPFNIHGRGIAYWPGDAKTAPRLIFATDGGLIMEVDVTTGKPPKDFGLRGRIDAYVGVSDEVVGESRRSTFTVPNPVMVYKDLFITAARPGEMGPPGPRGDIRAWDVRTGRPVWDFHTVPWPGEPNHNGYTGDQWRDVTGANVWSTMTLDNETGVLYASTGDLNSHAAGSHLYADCLLAIDTSNGKLKWFHQITHHDVWDWDSPTPPVLLNVDQHGKSIPAVLLTGKHSLLFLFDRRNGASLNGFTERPTPQPPTPSPAIWPTQPFPTAPGPLARIQMTRDEIPDLVPGMREACQKGWDDTSTVSEPLYGMRQSADHAALTYPSAVGGPNWGGGSYIPDLHMYFINVQNRASWRPKSAAGEPPSPAGPGGMTHPSPSEDGKMPAMRRPPRDGAGFNFRYKTPDGMELSCGALPWGELVAVNVDEKKIVWRVPLGKTEELGPAGEHTGSDNIGGSMATESGLVFIGATSDRRFRAFDAKTGNLLWETQLEAGGNATPITFMGKDGKQYVVIAAGGGTPAGRKVMSDTVVAFRLP